MSDELELSIDNFWKLLDRGEYKKCHKLLDSSDYDISKISTMRVATFFRELRKCLIENIPKWDSYLQDLKYFEKNIIKKLNISI